MANVVVPVAPPVPHVDQWVDSRAVLASAHDTIKVRGRTTAAPVQVRTRAPEPAATAGVVWGFVAADPAEFMPKPMATARRATPARTVKVRRMRR